MEVEISRPSVFISVLWRLWKWIIHIITGRCEIYRLALWSAPIYQKTWSIQRSLLLSRTKSLREVVRSGQMEVRQAMQKISSVKKIPASEQERFVSCVEPCVLRIRSVKSLLEEVESLRQQRYSQEDTGHEELLMELWSMLYPSVELEGRITKQWQDIGFQGNNPATDFRGMGLLGLTCLHYFSSHHGNRARSLLSRSHHPQYGYPYAIVSINLTSLAFTWLKAGLLDKYLYRTSHDWPLPRDTFMEIVCYLLVAFDEFWRRSKPENVMVFPAVREQFAENLKRQLLEDSDTLNLALDTDTQC